MDEQQPPQEPAARQVDRVSIKLPPFWKNDPKLWFIQLEAQFDLSNIVVDSTKYNYVVSAVDTEILTQVADFVTNPPATNKYEGIRSRLIDIYSESSEKKLRKLLSEVSLGDRKPSQLLNEMSRLGGSAVSEEILRTLWMQLLPSTVQSVLTTSSDSLENLAKMADKICEIDQPRVYATQTDDSTLLNMVKKLSEQVEELKTTQSHQTAHYHRDRSSSRHRNRNSDHQPQANTQLGNFSNSSNELCWYHFKYGNKARKCTPPCTRTSTQGNASPR